MAGGEVRVLASSICPPRSPAVASHASVTTLTTLCFLIPRHVWSSVSSSSTLSRKETVASCSDLTQAPCHQGRVQQVPTTQTDRCRNNRLKGRRNARRR